MNAAEALLRGFLEHPQRTLFVIILTCVVGLVTLWPLVDEYFVLVEDCVRAEQSIVEARQEIAAIDDARQLAADQSTRLKSLRTQPLAVEEVHKFSSQLVDLTRGAGCQLRRVDLGEAQKRRWFEEDHPLKVQPSKVGAKETAYELRTQRVALSISGPMDRIQSLLEEMGKIEKLVHTHSLQFKPATDERHEIHLDMEMLFFDLIKVKKDTST